MILFSRPSNFFFVFFIGFNVALQCGTSAKEDLLTSQTGTSTSRLPAQPVTRSKSPVTFGFNYKSDLGRNFSGGLNQRTDFLGNLNLTSQLDLEALASLPGLKLTVQGLAIHGSAPTKSVGDTQATSNLEATPTAKLYQAHLEKSWLQDQIALLAGLHDLNADFYLTEASAVFLNSSFAVGPELSHTGKTGPSIFPTPSLGGRLRIEPFTGVKILAAVYDGVPGNPREPRGTHVMLEPGDGVLAITEVSMPSYMSELSGTLGFGAWGYSEKFSHLSESDASGTPLKARSQGAYFHLNQKLFEPSTGSHQGLTGFLRAGLAAPEAFPIAYSSVFGLRYLGLLSSREQDQLGLGFAIAGASTYAKRSLGSQGIRTSPRETSIELTYRAVLTSWLSVQPDFQWVLSPGFNADVSDALIGGARLEVNL